MSRYPPSLPTRLEVGILHTVLCSCSDQVGPCRVTLGVTGLLLQGVSAGQRFDLTIPIAQTLGKGYQGEDDSGRSYFLKPVNRSRPKKVF